jgi:hypothetical protein
MTLIHWALTVQNGAQAETGVLQWMHFAIQQAPQRNPNLALTVPEKRKQSGDGSSIPLAQSKKRCILTP